MTTELPNQNLPVTRLKQYELIRLVKRGAKSAIYLAREATLDRHVAIKLLNSEQSSDSNQVWQFFSEAAAAARLQHPAIAQIYFVGQEGPYCFCARQFVEGTSLAQRLAMRETIPDAEVVTMIRQILDGLAAAHARGIVHNKLHPANVIFNQTRERIILTDFQGGEASASAGAIKTSLDINQDLQSLGKIIQDVFRSQRAPSEPGVSGIAGSSSKLDAFTQRLLGTHREPPFKSAAEALTEFESLTGLHTLSTMGESPGYEASSKSLDSGLQRGRTAIIDLPVMEEIPDLPSDLFSSGTRGASARWWQWLKERWSADVSRRLQDTHAAVDGALVEMERRQRWLDHLAVEGQALMGLLRPEANQAGHPDSAAEAGVAIAQQQRQLADIDHRRAELAVNINRLEMQRDLLNARLQAAERRLDRTVSTAAAKGKKTVQGLVQLVLAVGLLGFAGYTISKKVNFAELMKPDTSKPQVQLKPAAQITKGSVERERPMPDLSWVPEAETVLPLRSLRINTNDKVDNIAFCPGRSIVGGALEDGTIRIWSAETGDELQRFVNVYRGKIHEIRSVFFDRAGKTVNDYDLVTGVLGHLKIQGSSGDVSGVTYSPDGKQFAAISTVPNQGQRFAWRNNRLIALYDAESGQALSRVTPSAQDVADLEFSPTSPLLAYHDGKGRVQLWNSESKKMDRELVSPCKKLYHLKFSPDGRYLASNADAGTIALWNLEQSSEPILLVSQGPKAGPIVDINFSPQSNILAGTGDGVVSLWDIAQKKVLRYLLTNQKRVRKTNKSYSGPMTTNWEFWDNGCCSFSDDERYVATCGYEYGHPLIWDVSDLSESGGPATSAKKAGSFNKNSANSARAGVVDLKHLRYLNGIRQTDKPQFQSTLLKVAREFVQVGPTLNENPAKWQEVTLNQSGAGFDGIRFTSPLKANSDLNWSINLSAPSKDWGIVGASQPVPAFQASYEGYNLNFTELRVPDKNLFTFQSLSGGHIQPGQEYVIWFAFNTHEPVVLRFALSLQVGSAPQGPSNAEGIAKAMNWKLPLQHTDVPLELESAVTMPKRVGSQPAKSRLPFSGEKFPLAHVQSD